jgi:hypothetical protein
MLLHYGLDAGDVWIDNLIYSHFCTWDILVASTGHPAMLISMPFLGALKAKKYVQRDKEAIHRNHSHYKDAAQTSGKDNSKKKAITTSDANSMAK